MEVDKTLVRQYGRWPDEHGLVRAVFHAADWIELRFSPRPDPTKKIDMVVVRTADGGRTWTELPIKLTSLLDRLNYGEFWPPDPMDVKSVRLEGDRVEMVICEVAWMYATGGLRQWHVAYAPEKMGWSMRLLDVTIDPNPPPTF